MSAVIKPPTLPTGHKNTKKKKGRAKGRIQRRSLFGIDRIIAYVREWTCSEKTAAASELQAKKGR